MYNTTNNANPARIRIPVMDAMTQDTNHSVPPPQASGAPAPPVASPAPISGASKSLKSHPVKLTRKELIALAASVGGLALILLAMAVLVIVQLYRHHLTEISISRKNSNVPAVTIRDLVHVSEIAEQENHAWKMSWDFTETVADRSIPINLRVPQLRDWEPSTMAKDSETGTLLPVAPKRSKIAFQGDISIFVVMKLLYGDTFFVRFHYFQEEGTGYTVALCMDGKVEATQDRMSVVRAAQRTVLKGESHPDSVPLKHNEKIAILVETSGSHISVYIDSVLLFEGDMPKKWLIDQNSPEYKGGIPGENFGENTEPPDFGDVVFATEKPYQAIIQYIEITGTPADFWVEDMTKMFLAKQKALSFSETFVPPPDIPVISLPSDIPNISGTSLQTK